MRTARAALFAFAALAMTGSGAALRADEFPILAESTVIGRNHGYPTGAPGSAATPAGGLDLVVETALFFKNLELTGFEDAAIDGETFIGWLAPLRLRYRPHSRVHVEGGAMLGRNYGDDDSLDLVEPLLRLVYEPLPQVYVVGGSIIQTHWMHEAILDDVQVFRDGLEQGFQVRADRRHLKHDTWINWRVRESSARPEEFELGSATQARFGGFRLDGQVLWAHVGGQKNSSERVDNNYHILGGGSYGISPSSFIEEIRLAGAYIIGRDETRQRSASGSGYEGRLTVDLRPLEGVLLRLFGAWFHGDGLRARRGDPLYGFEEYGQAGFNLLFELEAGLRLETGFTAQLAGGELVNTYQIFLVWGGAFPLPSPGELFKSRAPRPEPVEERFPIIH
jgi:hypothetical protein